jgi:flagellar basal-body rod protein FlgC
MPTRPARRLVPTLTDGGCPPSRRSWIRTPGEIVKVGKIAYDMSDFQSRFEPGHPAADKDGYVKYPNVDPLVEAMDMREAQRTYEANLNVVTVTRQMLGRTLDILKG